MTFDETDLKGAYVIGLEPRRDDRGFFARTFCTQEFAARGLAPAVAQCNLSFNYREGILRGLHYQTQPAAEAKLVRCVRGAVYDLIVDLRPDSPTYLSHVGVELTAENRLSLYVPEMFAHGYQTLTSEAEVVYQVSQFYSPEHECELRYDDPALGIRWPLPVSEISEKDANWPLLGAVAVEGRHDHRR